jgi:hypothetical protein
VAVAEKPAEAGSVLGVDTMEAGEVSGGKVVRVLVDIAGETLLLAVGAGDDGNDGAFIRRRIKIDFCPRIL